MPQYQLKERTELHAIQSKMSNPKCWGSRERKRERKERGLLESWWFIVVKQITITSMKHPTHSLTHTVGKKC